MGIDAFRVGRPASRFHELRRGSPLTDDVSRYDYTRDLPKETRDNEAVRVAIPSLNRRQTRRRVILKIQNRFHFQ